MVRFFRICSPILAMILFMTGCGAKGPKLVKVREKDNGKTIEIRTGERLKITLDANPTTGYTWEFKSGDATMIKQIGEPDFKASSDATGAGGRMTLDFEPIGPGQTTLQLIYHRPFEQNTPPIKTFELNLSIR